MKIKYCWRCQIDVKMLNDEEFDLCRKALMFGKPVVDQELKKRNIANYIWLTKIETFEKYRYFLEMYKLITGEFEGNPNAIFHHQISQFGKDCLNCKKPYRTPKARYCAYCGDGKENLISKV